MLDKIFKYSRRLVPYKVKKHIASIRRRIFSIFSIVIIETSSACNRRCSYCPNSKFDRGLIENNRKLKIELFHKIIDELVELRWFGQIQSNFYNEPLLDERLPELMKYAKLKLPACSIVIYTNGDFLTIDLYKKLVECGVTDFVITEHQKQESDNINKLLEFRKSKGDDNVNVLYRKLGKFHSRGGLIELSAEEKEPKHCLWDPHIFIVNYEGEAVLCCEDYFNTVKLGNVGHEKLTDIWNKPYYKQLRDNLKRGIFKHEICKKCAVGKFSAMEQLI